MADQIEPGYEPGENRRVVLISLALIVFGLVNIPMSLVAFRTGEPIPMLSRTLPVYGWEGFVIVALAEILGFGGLWVVWRRRASPGT